MQNKKGVFLCIAILLLFSNFFAVHAENDRATMATKCLMLCYQAKNLYLCPDKFVLPETKGAKIQSFAFLHAAVGGSESFGYIMETQKKVYLVFRGTESWSDIWKDFIMWKRPFTHIPNGGNVHSGFLSIYEGTSPQQSMSLREQILNRLEELDPNKQLIITGFSLGGALATLCACDVVENSAFKNPVVYTFASPRVGDQQFVDAFNQKVKTNVRIVNFFDYVPCNPLYLLGYRHVKGEVQLKVGTGRVDWNHRITHAYFPGLLANVPEYVEKKVKTKDAGLCPPLPETLPQPSWEEKEDETPQVFPPPENATKKDAPAEEISQQ